MTWIARYATCPVCRARWHVVTSPIASHVQRRMLLSMLLLLAMAGCGQGGGGGGQTRSSPSAAPTDPATALTADFTASPMSGAAPLTVQFQDASTGQPSAWAWDFGDGTVSTEENPQHTYTTGGSFAVTLTVSGTTGSATVRKDAFVSATVPPVVAAPPVVPMLPAPTQAPTMAPTPTPPPPLAPPAPPPTTPTPPPTMPTVTLTAPQPGATVFALVSVVATATDPSGVAGVQFLADGAPLGAEVVATPYAVQWDTTAVTPGAHVLTARARAVSGTMAVSPPVSVTVIADTTAAHTGQWSAPFPLPLVAVHAALLASGQILTWDGMDQGYHAILLDPMTGVTTDLPPPPSNIFCTGLCALPDGRTLVAGGHADPHGHVGTRNTNLFDAGQQTWIPAAMMQYPRWYPTVTALPDGRVQVTSGEMNGDRDDATIPEVYDPHSDTWTPLPKAVLSLPYYPHMFVLPDGRLLAAGSAEDPIEPQVLDLTTQTWSVVSTLPVDGGSAAMYLPGKILTAGTTADSDPPYFSSAPTTYVLDMTSPAPAWRQTAPMAFARTYLNVTLLPDGTILATGGGATTDPGDVAGAVSAAELWSPTTETWTVMASMQMPRLYHSTALLLPDGRVITMGGGRFSGPSDPNQLSAEIFSPPYLFRGPRPVLTSVPPTVVYGTSLAVQTPDAARIASVALLKLGTVTHAFNQDQRYVPLAFTRTTGALTVRAPATATVAPPGSYMLFLVDTTGVPSSGAIMHVQATP